MLFKKRNVIIKLNYENIKTYFKNNFITTKCFVVDNKTNIFKEMKATLISSNPNNVDKQKLNNYYQVCAQSEDILKRLNDNLKTMLPDNLWLFLETFKQENPNIDTLLSEITAKVEKQKRKTQIIYCVQEMLKLLNIKKKQKIIF